MRKFLLCHHCLVWRISISLLQRSSFRKIDREHAPPFPQKLSFLDTFLNKACCRNMFLSKHCLLFLRKIPSMNNKASKSDYSLTSPSSERSREEPNQAPWGIPVIKKGKLLTLCLFREMPTEKEGWTLDSPVFICISSFMHIFTFINSYRFIYLLD